MEDKDIFKSRIKRCLEEETKDIYFSPEAREKVKQEIFKEGWWNRSVSFSLAAVAFGVIALFFAAALYAKAFFYISPKEITELELRAKIILPDHGVPFGAVQHLRVALKEGKGDARP
ncbi:hypothetical protein [Candidatus Formimonas warabiya]|uniref:Uncharacterized protein n=1 Tax=Formimonas warabiya TaxID=1761012 RepID=A0A3G1KW77_FORW1|nr:hypothetical protein [Candidatus Formimonas warabiya]ATW26793.1 hypothetical protein DCMF_20290 [Candidatus Formimonas warabiya]